MPDLPHRPLPRRHRLARLTPAGWRGVLRQPWDAQARACLAHWASHGLPLVVTRQPADAAVGGWIALGLPAPPRWDRRRLALRVPHVEVDGFDEFPRLADAWCLLDAQARGVAREVVDALAGRHATAHVFGSHGWQALSRLVHVRPSSDLDLWIAVDGVAHADEVARALQAFEGARPRLDGELVFADGAAVAWREWTDWRAGRARAVMVKRIDGVALRHDTAWCAASPSREPGP